MRPSPGLISNCQLLSQRRAIELIGRDGRRAIGVQPTAGRERIRGKGLPAQKIGAGLEDDGLAREAVDADLKLRWGDSSDVEDRPLAGEDLEQLRRIKIAGLSAARDDSEE